MTNIRPAGVTYTWCGPENSNGLEAAIAKLYRELHRLVVVAWELSCLG